MLTFLRPYVSALINMPSVFVLAEESRLQVYFLQKSEKFKKLYRCCSERLKEKRNSQVTLIDLRLFTG